MNHPSPFPHLFQNPNHNFFFQPFPPPPPPPQPIQIPPTTTKIPDLSSTLSSLTNLLSLSHQTLDSLPPQITLQTPQNSNFIRCPHNPHHLMPPESLFLHSLSCPSPLFENPSSLFASLYFPISLNLKNPFNNPIQCLQSTELCFSLDDFFSQFCCSNFFYKDCPGVVNFNELDSLNKMFTLPGVLLAECGNFVGSDEGKIMGLDENAIRVLPSELWGIRREVEGWVDYPVMCSYGVVCAISRLNCVKESDLKSWVIVGSPWYGVVIDVYMRDHISVLFRLCFKAIRREALGLVDCEISMKSLSFKCPVLVQVLVWVASQLSNLYGEVNAKCFAVHIFKQCVLRAANELLLISTECSLTEFSTDLDAKGNYTKNFKLEEPVEGSAECSSGNGVDGCVDKEVVIVPQVAAAVAALHERSMLEAKIKGLRGFQSLTSYQRITDHAHVSKRADEERKRRSNYRAIIEHDGIPRKRSSDQETSKIKTREELLAEERDYKRRRMSYRGKKVKRTTVQVTRDIIDELMEEIKGAGGIGCFEKGAEDEVMSGEPPTVPYVTMPVDKPIKSNFESSAVIRDTSDHDWKHSDLSHKDSSPHDYEKHRRGHDEHHEHLGYRKRGTNGDRHGREHYSRSPERHESQGRSHDWSRRQRERDNVESTRTYHHERSSVKSNYQNYKSSYSMSDSTNNFRLKDVDKRSDAKDRTLGRSYEKNRSYILAENAFADRYVPEETHDMHEDV